MISEPLLLGFVLGVAAVLMVTVLIMLFFE